MWSTPRVQRTHVRPPACTRASVLKLAVPMPLDDLHMFSLAPAPRHRGVYMSCRSQPWPQCKRPLSLNSEHWERDWHLLQTAGPARVSLSETAQPFSRLHWRQSHGSSRSSLRASRALRANKQTKQSHRFWTFAGTEIYPQQQRERAFSAPGTYKYGRVKQDHHNLEETVAAHLCFCKEISGISTA